MWDSIHKLAKVLRAPSHWKFILHDLWGSRYEIHDDNHHLTEAVLWLLRAQDKCGVGGLSAGYYPAHGGWLDPYPETTGYIIPTFLQYARFSGNGEFVKRAILMGDWEIAIQLESGAVRAGTGLRDYPAVFNTGQVIHGWACLFLESGLKGFLNAAIKAADWLLSVQDDDGKWSSCDLNNIPHTYHTRVAWPLLELFQTTGNERYRESALRNVRWALAMQNDNGWFRHTGFSEAKKPLTHTIGYTLEGLLGCVPYLDRGLQDRVLASLRLACDRILERYRPAINNGNSMKNNFWIPASLDENWASVDRYQCVTGLAQLSLVLLQLSKLSGDTKYLIAGNLLLDNVKSLQCLISNNPGIRGAIPGSYPCWGAYNPFSFPNWATKFFVDALLARMA